MEEIMKNLSEFRRRTSVPTPDYPSSSQQISFSGDLQAERGAETRRIRRSVPGKPGQQIPFDYIRESMRQIRGQKGADRMSSSKFMGSLRSKPSDSEVIGGMSAFPDTVFGKEMRERKRGRWFLVGGDEYGLSVDIWAPGIGLLRLREMEEKKAMSNPTGAVTMVLRDALSQMGENKDDKSKKTSPQRTDMLGLLGGTPTYLMRPPKEQLVEKAMV
ncbi:hypothetical protein SESBI_08526 [Sesbania bispinosa]|nr:hypothetical protein SESBI_08526 [Sesbania bispinosa]